MNISQLVLQTIYRYNMIDKGDKVLVAVSGGADSICLLHILNNLKADLGFDIACAHVNHGLRGEAADSDERYVKEFCEKLGIPFFVKHEDVGALANAKKLTVEEAGRFVRYNFFAELKKVHGFNKIATAHNKNDNAETVFMRIIRGTGIDGLGGISYVREDAVIRPILDVSRTDIEDYCNENELKYCTDATNFDNDYTRNKIRNELIPYLEKEFNSKVSDSLIRLANSADEDSKFINGYAKRLFDRLGSPLPGKTPNAIHIESFKMVDRAIGARIIRIAARKSAGDVKLERKHIDDIFDILDKPTGTSIDLPEGLKAEINYGWLTFRGPLDNKAVELSADGFFEEVSVGESVYLEGIGKNISLREESAKTYKLKINEIAADLDKLGNQPLFLRNRRSGDRLAWFADGRTKKVKKIFIDEKIPQKDRDKIPLICTGDEVVAIVGNRVSEKYKLTKDSERALVIEYGNIE
ncbi:MAG: tRNA lysidine(34) synthetase TilS [Clostridia bacterium]|nr:tRNA lysidine(34) synthetase TilS [Clostridia bacterium]